MIEEDRMVYIIHKNSWFTSSVYESTDRQTHTYVRYVIMRFCEATLISTEVSLLYEGCGSDRINCTTKAYLFRKTWNMKQWNCLPGEGTRKRISCQPPRRTCPFPCFGPSLWTCFLLSCPSCVENFKCLIIRALFNFASNPVRNVATVTMQCVRCSYPFGKKLGRVLPV